VGAQTLDLMARDQRTGSVLLATSAGGAGTSVELRGVVRVSPEPGSAHGLELPLAAWFSGDDAEEFNTEHVEDSLRFFHGAGAQIGPEVESYKVVPSIDNRYEIHSGVVIEEDGPVDVVGISDVVEIAIVAIVGGACLVRYAGEFFLLNKTLDMYRERGLVPKLKVRSGVFQALTCRFDFDIDAIDPQGNVVESEQVHIGRRKKK
jgi:hypothetical protein